MNEMPYRVVDVVWSEPLPQGFELLLACGHRIRRPVQRQQDVCTMCPEVPIGDEGPLDRWTRFKTVRFSVSGKGGVA